MAGSQVDLAQQERIECDDDGRTAHENGRDGWSDGDSPTRKETGSDGNCDDVVADSPTEILQHLAVTGFREIDDSHDRARIAGGKNDSGGFDGYIGAGTDGDTE